MGPHTSNNHKITRAVCARLQAPDPTCTGPGGRTAHSKWCAAAPGTPHSRLLACWWLAARWQCRRQRPQLAGSLRKIAAGQQAPVLRACPRCPLQHCCLTLVLWAAEAPWLRLAPAECRQRPLPQPVSGAAADAAGAPALAQPPGVTPAAAARGVVALGPPAVPAAAEARALRAPLQPALPLPLAAAGLPHPWCQRWQDSVCVAAS